MLIRVPHLYYLRLENPSLSCKKSINKIYKEQQNLSDDPIRAPKSPVAHNRKVIVACSFHMLHHCDFRVPTHAKYQFNL